MFNPLFPRASGPSPRHLAGRPRAAPALRGRHAPPPGPSAAPAAAQCGAAAASALGRGGRVAAAPAPRPCRDRENTVSQVCPAPARSPALRGRPPPPGVGVAPQPRGASKWLSPFALPCSGAQSRAGVVTSLASRCWQGLPLPPGACLGPSEVYCQPRGLKRGREVARAPLRWFWAAWGHGWQRRRSTAAEAVRVPRLRGGNQLYLFFQNHR